jgi:WD40 repeat protein
MLAAVKFAEDLQISFFDPATWSVVKTSTEHNRAYAIAFSPDGARFATVGLNGTLQIWDRESLAPLGEAVHLPSFFSSILVQLGAIEIHYTPDGKMLVIDVGETIFLWDIESQQMIGLPLPSAGRGIGLSQDGLRLFTPNLVWNLDTREWEKAACRTAGRNLTEAEWNQYFPGEEYRPTCPEWP